MRTTRFATAVLTILFVAAVLVLPTLAAAKTFTGKVSDTMCGAKHMGGSDSACTHACVKQGSSYALVVGDKVYKLETSDKAALDKLNELAGASANVTGEVKGDAIEVKSVAAGK